MKIILRLQNDSVNRLISIEPNTSVSFGRTNKSQVQISDSLLSGIHCTVFYHPYKIIVVDENSKNGTTINGSKISRSEVYIGDTVEIGKTQLSIASERMDHLTVEALTFKGNKNDRFTKSISLDFEHQHLQLDSHQKIKVSNPKSSVKSLTKQDIKIKYKRESTLASYLDLGAVAALALLIHFTTRLILLELGAGLDVHRFLVAQILGVGSFSWFNFKKSSFTLGEKFAGIKRLMDKEKDKEVFKNYP